MTQLETLGFARGHRWVRVDCEGGARFVVDADRGAVLRVPGDRAPRAPLDGRWWLGSALVDDTTGAPTLRVGARARWLLARDLFMFTGRIVRITLDHSPEVPGRLAPGVRWPLRVPA